MEEKKNILNSYNKLHSEEWRNNEEILPKWEEHSRTTNSRLLTANTEFLWCFSISPTLVSLSLLDLSYSIIISIFLCVSFSVFYIFCIFRRVVFSSILLLLLRARLRRCLFFWNVRSTDRDLRWMSLTEAGLNFTFTRTTVLLSREKCSSASSSSLNRASKKNQSVFLSPKNNRESCQSSRILEEIISNIWRAAVVVESIIFQILTKKKSTTADLEIIHSRSFWWWWLLLIVRPGHRCSWCCVVMYG